jgi:alkyldihydroxyacetonephosphate synthase
MLDTALIESLAQVLGHDNVLTHEDDLDRYSTDALTPARAFRAAPRLQKTADAVVIPRSAQQVSDVVKLASAYKVPIVPYGGGTGVMGAAFPVQGGIVVDLKGLNRVLDVNPTDKTALVEAGVVLEDLVEALDERGLMLGHDPWSVPIATVAGTISTNGVGYRAAAYGPMGEQVLGLEVVLPNGQVLTTRSVPKYSSGPNLNHLFIGTEGAFGVITKATLRVFRQPEERSFATVGFDSFDQGFKAVAELFALGLRPTLVDLTEEYGEGVRLYMMYEGYKEGVSAQKSRSLQVCSGFEGKDLGKEEVLEYWQNRHSSGESYRREMLNKPRNVRWQRRGRGFDYLHMALPVSQVLGYRQRCEEMLSRRGIKVVEYAIWTQPELFSMLMVPDGGLNPHNHLEEVSDEAIENMAEAVDEVLTLAQDVGGTMEYCHGVGVKLAHLLPREMGVGLEVAKAMKAALDPDNIMNPGKLF